MAVFIYMNFNPIIPSSPGLQSFCIGLKAYWEGSYMSSASQLHFCFSFIPLMYVCIYVHACMHMPTCMWAFV